MQDVRLKELAPGATLCVIPADRFKKSRLELQMALPLRLGEPKATAANAMLPYLLRRSCAAYPTPRLLESRLAALYGASLYAGAAKLGETHWLSLSLSVIEDRFAFAGDSLTADCAALLEELLFRPRLAEGLFSAEAVELEKRLLCERLESEQGEKRIHSIRRMEALMCGNEAFGLNAYGTPEAIMALTPADMAAAWRNLLSRAKMQITLVSAGDGAAVEATFRGAFAGITRDPVVLGGEFIPAASAVRSFTEYEPVEQAKLVLGFRVGMRNRDDHNFATRMMADIFGGGVYSKLFTVVREEKSLCYYCAARANRYKGTMVVFSGVDRAKAEEAREAILEQLAAIQEGDFSDELIADSRRSLRDTFFSVVDAPESLADYYSTGLITGEYLSPREIYERLEAVTREEIIAAAKQVTLDTVYLLCTAKKEGDAA
ncbi:MAG: insulinase family protein [Oscillospiraceae bacterium]|nr:insulinase family protein [Oscillospiraceae bacterium]